MVNIETKVTYSSIIVRVNLRMKSFMDQALTAFWSGALCDKVFVTQSPTVAIVGGLIQLELAGNMDKQL